MKNTIISLVAACLVCAGGWRVSLADDPAGQPQSVTYALNEGSTYQEGCFEACACPTTIPLDMQGTFVLTMVQDYPGFKVFDVTDVAWTVPDLGLAIAGAGSYTVFSEFIVQQQMELDLQINGEPVDQFDSGWVLGDDDLSNISIILTMNDYFCYDIVLTLDAGPLCECDLNLDGTVDGGDLAGLLGHWGPCIGCAADFDQDGIVGPADMALLLGDWGACWQ